MEGHQPQADFLCTACGHHERAQGRARVTEFVRGNPATTHTCDTEAITALPNVA
jgi:hypothetical protein